MRVRTKKKYDPQETNLKRKSHEMKKKEKITCWTHDGLFGRLRRRLS